jgi:hypothetical protein
MTRLFFGEVQGVEGHFLEPLVGSITLYFFFWTAFTHAAVSTNFCAPKPGSQRTNPFQVGVRHHITAVSAFPSYPSLCAPPHIAEYFLHVINYFGSDDQPRERFQAHIPSLMMQQPRPLGPPGNTASLTTLLNIQHNIKLNHINPVYLQGQQCICTRVLP